MPVLQFSSHGRSICENHIREFNISLAMAAQALPCVGQQLAETGESAIMALGIRLSSVFGTF
jgi:hypothetical protein